MVQPDTAKSKKAIRKVKMFFRFRKALRLLIQKLLPRRYKHAALRGFIQLDYQPSPRLKVRLAQTQSDLDAALKLLHDSYVAAGFMDPQPSGLRVTKYHSLPATSTIVALWDDKVVGTLSLIRRSAFGMPLESIFDISKLTQDGSRILETSSLAVDANFSGQHGVILFPLIKFLVEYSLHYFGSTYLAIAVNPAWIEFYEAVLGFERLSSKTVAEYSFVKGAPAVGAYINLHDLDKNLKDLYGTRVKEKNLHRYLFDHKLANLQFPERKFKKISDPVLTPEIIDYFFNQRTQTFATMSEREIFTLHQLYQDDAFRRVLPRLPPSSPVYRLRDGLRMDVNLAGRVHITGHLSIPIVVTDISKNGLGIVAERELRQGQLYDLTISVDGKELFLEKTELLWSSSNGPRCGLTVVNPPTAWHSYVDLLRDDLLRRNGVNYKLLSGKQRKAEALAGQRRGLRVS